MVNTYSAWSYEFVEILEFEVYYMWKCSIVVLPRMVVGINEIIQPENGQIYLFLYHGIG